MHRIWSHDLRALYDISQIIIIIIIISVILLFQTHLYDFW